MTAIGVIPARGGSKGIPRKNIASLAGKPLLAWTAEAALGSRGLHRVLLSTDDDEIAAVGRAQGLEVPFLRPPELATDSAPSLNVLLHALQWLDDAGRSPDVVVLLQPTTPLRTSEDIDAALMLLHERDADSVVSIAAVPSHYAPEWQLRLSEAGQLALLDGRPLSEITPRRQLLSNSYYRNGAIYAVKHDVLASGRGLYGETCIGYLMPAERSINIDGPDELAEAEGLLLRRRA